MIETKAADLRVGQWYFDQTLESRTRITAIHCGGTLRPIIKVVSESAMGTQLTANYTPGTRVFLLEEHEIDRL